MFSNYFLPAKVKSLRTKEQLVFQVFQFSKVLSRPKMNSYRWTVLMDGCGNNTDVEDCINGTVQVLEFPNRKAWLYQSFNFHPQRLSFQVQKTKYEDELSFEVCPLCSKGNVSGSF